MAMEEWKWPDELDALLAAPEYHTLLMENEQVRREAEAKKRSQSTTKGGDWMSIFDAGDQATRDVVKKKAAAAAAPAAPAHAPHPKKPPAS